MHFVRFLGSNSLSPNYSLHLPQNGLHGDGFLLNYSSPLYSQWQNCSKIAKYYIVLRELTIIGWISCLTCVLFTFGSWRHRDRLRTASDFALAGPDFSDRIFRYRVFGTKRLISDKSRFGQKGYHRGVIDHRSIIGATLWPTSMGDINLWEALSFWLIQTSSQYLI